MKTALLSLLILCFVFQVQAQSTVLIPLDKVTKKINYAFTVPASGKNQAELIASAQTWAARVAADPALSAVSQLQGNTLTLTITQPFSFKCAGKIATKPLRFTARVCLSDGHFEYELTDFLLLIPNNPIQEAEHYILHSSSENPVAARCIANQVEAFVENATAYCTGIQNALLNKAVPAPSGPPKPTSIKK